MDIDWDKNITSFLMQWLGGDSPIELYNAPNKRAVFAFDNGTCNAFFASPTNFSDVLNRKDVFKIKTPVLHAELSVYSKAEIDFHESRPPAPEALLQRLNQPQYSIGYYDTNMINEFMTKFDRANQLPLPSIEKAFELLRESKIDFVLTPELDTGLPDMFEKQKTGLLRIQSLISVPLYLWLDDEYKQQESQIEQKLKVLLKSPEWSRLKPTS